MSRQHNIKLSIAIIAMMVLPTLVVSVSARAPDPVVQSQVMNGLDELDQLQGLSNGPRDPGAPWISFDELLNLYLANDKFRFDQPGPGYTYGGAGTLFCADSPPAPPGCGGAAPQEFNMGEAALFTMDISTSPAPSGTIWIGSVDPRFIDVELFGVQGTTERLIGKTTIEMPGVVAGTGPGGAAGGDEAFPYDYTLDPVPGSTEMEVRAGEVLTLRFTDQGSTGSSSASGAGELFTEVFIEYGTEEAPAFLQLIADSARLSAWTEDGEGARETIWPSAERVPVEEREVNLLVAHLAGWGEEYRLGQIVDASTTPPTRGITASYDTSKLLTGVTALGVEDTPPRSVDLIATFDSSIIGDPVNGMELRDREFYYPNSVGHPTTPDGWYQFVVDGDRGWEHRLQFLVGGFDFEVALQEGSFASHTVKVGHATLYNMEITNLGSQEDDFVVSFGNPGSGWSAELSRNQFFLQPGQTDKFTLTVFPPANGNPGDSKTITVTGVASEGNLVRTKDVTVLLTALDKPAGLHPTVDVSSPNTLVSTRPGFTEFIPITVHNQAYIEQTFLMTAGGAPNGWGVTLAPSTLNVYASTRAAYVAQVVAPADAVPGDTYTLNLRATNLNDATDTDVVSIPIQIFIQDLFEVCEVSDWIPAPDADIGCPTTEPSDLSAFPARHEIRDEGPGQSGAWNSPAGLADDDFDQTSIFRVIVRNTGDRDDDYVIEPHWAITSAAQDRNNCEGDDASVAGGDGVPDGWRFAIRDDMSTLPGSSTAMGPKQVTSVGNGKDDGPFDMTISNLPRGEIAIVYVEVGWRTLAGGGCASGDQTGGGARGADPSPDAFLDIRVQSASDPTLAGLIRLHSELVSPGGMQANPIRHYTGGQNGVLVLDGDGVLPARPAATDSYTLTKRLAQGLDTSTLPDYPYTFRAVNAGNEMDVIEVDLPKNVEGFQFEMDLVDDSRAFGNQGQGSGVSKTGGCTDVSTSTSNIFRCSMGAFDEATFGVNVVVPANAPIGYVLPAFVTLTSRDTIDKGYTAARELVNLRTVVTGDYAFEFQPYFTERNTHAGRSVSFPFSISNTGFEDDTYDLAAVGVPAGWAYSFNSAQLFVPSQSIIHGFLTLTAPVDAELGTEVFKFEATSQALQAQANPGSPPKRVADMSVTVANVQGSLVLQGAPREIVIVQPDISTPAEGVMRVEAVGQPTDAGDAITFTIDKTNLPQGWILTGTDDDADPDEAVISTIFDGDGLAYAEFNVRATKDDLTTSRVVFRVESVHGTNEEYVEMLVNLASLGASLQLELPGGALQLVVPGSTVDYEVVVVNNGNAADTVRLTHDDLPSGFGLTYNTNQVTVNPFSTASAFVTITTPAGLSPGQQFPIRLYATSGVNPSIVAEKIITLTTGESDLQMTLLGSPLAYVAPEETVSFTISATNAGQVSDFFDMSTKVSAAFAGTVTTRIVPAQLDLQANQTKQFRLEVTMGPGLVSGARVPVELRGASAGESLQTVGIQVVEVEVLRHRALDVDGDLFVEYAVDRDRVLENGFEEFREGEQGQGVQSTSLDMASYLTESARQNFTSFQADANGTLQPIFGFVFDLDGDGRSEFMVDTDRDLLPDVWWNPRTNVMDKLEISKDVTNDGIREYFVDVDADDLLDVYYDIRTGEVGNLLRVDIDGDGEVDYVVDLNGNGVADLTEPVLFGKNGRVVRITELVDVNGDGKLDTVVDEDGDGNPDYFIPNGGTRGIKIVLEDVTGDGFEDWTFDSNGDGSRDRYYDPVNNQYGDIDTQAEFVRNIVKYWYVGAIFAIVVVLFIVLVAVTRR